MIQAHDEWKKNQLACVYTFLFKQFRSLQIFDCVDITTGVF